MFQSVLTNLLVKILTKGRVSEGNKKLDNLVVFLFILGILLFIGVAIIGNKTIIDFKIPLLICLTPGIILTPLFYNQLNYIDGLKIHWIAHYFLHTCMTGSILLFSFMATNYYFADKEITTKKIEILDKGSSSGPKGKEEERVPYVIINYDNLEQKLKFSYFETEVIDSAKFVNIFIRKGFFDFDIIEKYNVE
jgi:hypothetical protein